MLLFGLRVHASEDIADQGGGDRLVQLQEPVAGFVDFGFDGVQVSIQGAGLIMSSHHPTGGLVPVFDGALTLKGNLPVTAVDSDPEVNIAGPFLLFSPRLKVKQDAKTLRCHNNCVENSE